MGEAIKGAHCIAVRGAGKRLSARGVHVAAVAREQGRSAHSAPLPDAPCQPSDAIDACIEVGVFPEDAADSDPTKDMALMTFAEAASCVQFKPTDFVSMLPGDVDAIDRLGGQGFATAFAMNVWASYEALTAGNSLWTGPQPGEQVLGAHQQVIVGRELVNGIDCCVVWGSWSTSFADGGFSYIPRQWIKDNAWDCFGVQGGPIL